MRVRVYKHLGTTVTPISVDKMHNHSTNVDTERQSEPSHPLNEVSRDTVYTVLQMLESKLGRVLEGHMQEIKMLRESTTAGKGSSVMTQSPTQPRRSSTMTATPDNDVTEWNNQKASHINIHVNHLDEFLTGYMKNIRLLQDRLKNPDSPDPTAATSRDFESLRKQFEMQVVISTFSAGLIVGFGSLIHNLLVQSPGNKKLFDAGLLVSFFTISCHIFIIAISGRCASMSSDNQITGSMDHGRGLLNFALLTCDHLYMVAIYSFSATLLMMSFVVFENVAYPAAYCGTVALGIVALFSSRLKHLMVLYRVFRLLVQK
ncbi:hypothetical protein M378DRAFT_570743 [Amanita muscaria Koide BX008]|uniref:Uncharacterized protein n=1 Tax=Amanita muscaria (strain Koide BX008) TaxID=946122 RepID=A0A0C2X7F4_AMAMK|nr:hypothetical protein M378DRAFT_570743 [Amanita muscaria Koide BX008]